ncbi:MAG: hypothetical protein H7834_07935 [Magnetococcus sp. YQC-9]
MISSDRWLQAPLQWLNTTLQRLTQPLFESAAKKTDTPVDPAAPPWSWQAFRTTLTQTGRRLAELLLSSDKPPVEPLDPTPAEPLTLYSATGQTRMLAPLERSTLWMRPAARGGVWRDPSFRVELSPQGRVAGGAMTSVYAAPGELDRFVESIRVERQAGFYPNEVFDQARVILRKGECLEAGSLSGS